VVLFEMLAGRRPFPNSSPYGVIAEVLTAPIPSIATLVPEVSPGLVHVVERCLTRDVSVRVASADEVVGLLRPLQDQGAGGHTSVRSIADDLSSFDDAARVAPSDPPPRPPLPSEPTLPRFQPAPMAPDASLSRPRLGGAAPLRLGMPRPGLLHVVPGSRMAVPLRLGVPRPALSVPPSASPPLSPDAAEDGQATPVASARRP
jgi:serine/threonine-protein kinase